MKIKSFYVGWTNQEISEYLRSFNVLVLFSPELTGLKIKVYGDMSENKKDELKGRIKDVFGGQAMTNEVCDKINEFASKWYRKFVLGKTYRVINKTRRSI